jgi:CBS domain-containing protein
MLGIITERDLVRACATLEWSDDLQHVKASELMTRAVVSCGPQDTLQKAQDLMRTYNFRHVPVVEGERVIGILSIRDTLALRLQETEEEVNVLRDVVVAARHR